MFFMVRNTSKNKNGAHINNEFITKEGTQWNHSELAGCAPRVGWDADWAVAKKQGQPNLAPRC